MERAAAGLVAVPTPGGFSEPALAEERFGAAGLEVAAPMEGFFVVGRFGAEGFLVADFVAADFVAAGFVPGRLRAALFAGGPGDSAGGSTAGAPGASAGGSTAGAGASGAVP
jgi:hypothetical protein